MSTPETLDGPVATICLGIAFDGFVPPAPTFANLTGGTWGHIPLVGLDGSVEEKAHHLSLTLRPKEGHAHDGARCLEQIFNTLNLPVRAVLQDGSVLSAEFGNLDHIGVSVSPSGITRQGLAELWKWQHGDIATARVWVGAIHGVAFRIGNLSMREQSAAKRRTVGDALRLQGTYTWHLIRSEQGSRCTVVIDAGERSLNRDALRCDFQALEFSLGSPLRINMLVGYDADLNVRGSMGTAFGFREAANRGTADGPVPDRLEVQRWRPVLFNRLARHLAGTAGPSLDVAIGAYLDALSDHLDGAYLKAQVALEATCAQIPKKSGTAVLVREPKAWLAWVAANEATIANFAIDEAAARKLLSKVNSALNAPSTDTVEDALESLSVDVPEELIKEVRERGRVAHRYMMNKSQERDIQRDVQRLDRLKTLHTAIVAKIVGYDGPITGWTRDAEGWPLDPDWWPASSSATSQEALAKFLCTRNVNNG